MKLKFIKNKNGFKSYQANNFKIYYGVKNSTVGDNQENPTENIYLVKGELKITIGDKTKIIKAPEKIKIPGRTYHQLTALSKEVIFLVF